MEIQDSIGPFKVVSSSQNIFICSGEKNAISGGSPCTDHDGADDDTEEEEEENIDVGLIDNLKTAGGALLLLVLFLRNTSIIIVSGY